jgi:hypothetical protein
MELPIKLWAIGEVPSDDDVAADEKSDPYVEFEPFEGLCTEGGKTSSMTSGSTSSYSTSSKETCLDNSPNPDKITESNTKTGGTRRTTSRMEVMRALKTILHQTSAFSSVDAS